ncbi:MAG: hypothetical protein HY788_10070 [Deltaproteobacteria bacterium]|nr:hypothetical protein [Deltaproteobacteria bacterium]
MVDYKKKQRLISLNDNYKEYKRVFAALLSNLKDVIASEHELGVTVEDAEAGHLIFSYLDARFEAALGVHLAKTGKPFGKITFSKVQSDDPKERFLLSTLYFNDIGNATWNVEQPYPDMNIEKRDSAHHLLVEWLNQFLEKGFKSALES